MGAQWSSGPGLRENYVLSFILCVWVFFAGMHICAACGVQKRASEPLALELQTVVSCQHTRTQVLCTSSGELSATKPSLQALLRHALKQSASIPSERPAKERLRTHAMPCVPLTQLLLE